jgi:endonuclease YncB( thermonuclease family)
VAVFAAARAGWKTAGKWLENGWLFFHESLGIRSFSGITKRNRNLLAPSLLSGDRGGDVPFDAEAQLLFTWIAGGALLVAALLGRRLRRLLGRWLGRVHPSASVFTGKAYVIDGDTIEVGRARVRLFGMDAPELTQRGGHKAKSHMIGLAGGKTVTVHPVDVDCYGRIVARVECAGVDLSKQMVADGFARAMTGWHLDYAADEWQARRGERGLWAGDPGGGIGDPGAHRRAQAARAGERW